MQKRVTINLDSEVYEHFQDFCHKNDIIISKRIERLINKELEDQGHNKIKGAGKKR